MKTTLIIIVLILTGAVVWWVTSGDTDETTYTNTVINTNTSTGTNMTTDTLMADGLQKYSSGTYGFSFMYGPENDATETASGVSVTPSIGEGSSSGVFISYESTTTESADLPFAEFVKERAVTSCTADGVTGSVECAETVEQEDVTVNGINGLKLTLTETTTSYGSGINADTVVDRMKAVYAFDVGEQTNGKLRALLIEAALGEGTSVSVEAQAILDEILETLTF